MMQRERVVVALARRAETHALAAILLALGPAAARPADAQASVTGTVFDSLRTNAPMKGATVVIAELSKYAPTDARGRFRIDSLPAGRYTITFLHPALDSLDLAAEASAIDVPATGSLTTQLATPSNATLYARLCGGPGDPSLGLLIGHVTNVDDSSPIGRAVVTADWMEYWLEGGKMRGAVVRVNAISNANGVYVLCGVPVDSPYQVFALADSSGAGPVPMQPDPRAVSRLNLAVSRRDSAAVLLPAALLDTLRRGTPLSERRGSATVTGRVIATDGRPIVLADVRLAGSRTETRSDSGGRFRLSGIPAGTRALEVRAIGIAPSTLVLDVPSTASIDTVVRLDRRAQALGEVTVLGDKKSIDRSGFEERRKEGLGHFLTKAEIEKVPTPDLFGQWMRLPGLITLTDFKGVRHLVMRGGNGVGSSANSRMRMCDPAFYLDGAYFPLDSGDDPYKSILGFAPTDGTVGIEVYTSAGGIPPQFNKSSTTGCGSVVIWTK